MKTIYVKPVCGEISYYDSGEIIQFTNPDDFIKEIEECFYYRGIWGWSFSVSEKYLDLKSELNEIVLGEFGEP